MAPKKQMYTQLKGPLRLGLLLNNVISLSLSFAADRAIFYVLGSILVVSLLVNAFIGLKGLVDSRKRAKAGYNTDAVIPPHFFVIFLDVLGAFTFLGLYIGATVDVANDWGYDGRLLMKTYASIGSLVASVLHATLVLAQLHQYVQWRCSERQHCPNCNQVLRGSIASYVAQVAPIALPEQSDDKRQSLPRDSFSSSAAGHDEEDTLIMHPEA